MAGDFGTVFAPEMSITWFKDGKWSDTEFVSSDRLPLHPAAHVFHYASTCFEGLKAFKHADGSVHIFRIDQNMSRFAQSSRLISLPEINEAQVTQMIIDLVAKYADLVPEAPGSMYIRPTHVGTEAAVGKAAAASDESTVFTLISPVGDYFAGGDATLRLLVETDIMRCAPHMGIAKTGGNYASALGPIEKARENHQANQVLFCPNGKIQETGAANFLLIDGNIIITPALDSTFLHGITRASLLIIAQDLGYTVEERELTVAELQERAQHPDCEAALSGTAAVLAAVSELVIDNTLVKIGSGTAGDKVRALRQSLNDIQWGKAPDARGWLTKVI